MMLDLLAKAFPSEVQGKWNAKLVEIIPSYGQDLAKNPELLDKVRTDTSRTLGLVYTPKNQTPEQTQDKPALPSDTNPSEPKADTTEAKPETAEVKKVA